METVNPLLWKFLESPRRGLIVITLTALVGLLTLWPAVDNYFRLCQSERETVVAIEQAKQQEQSLPDLKARLNERVNQLKQLEQGTINDKQARQLRNDLVEWTRAAGCQVRRIEVDPAQRRPWLEDDHPLRLPMHNRNAKQTPYILRTQKLIVSIRGDFPRVRNLLAQIQETPHLMHTHSLSVRPLGEDSSEVMLELQVIMFDLENKQVQPTA